VVARVVPGTATTSAHLDTTGFGGGDGITDVPGTDSLGLTDVAVTPDGHVVFLDQVPSTTHPGRFDSTVVRLTSTGTLDDGYGSATGAHITVPAGTAVNTYAQALAVLPHGAVAVAGSTDVGSFIARLRPGGRPDKAMGPGGVKTLHDNENLVDVAALPDGRILAAGSSGTRDVLYRLTGDLKPPSCAGKKATIVGTHAADTLVGTAHPDVITGLGGKDTITGLGKGDIICGGPGGDTLRGGPGRDHLIGGPGHDKLRGGPGHDTLKQ